MMHAYDVRPRSDKRGVIAGVAIVGGGAVLARRCSAIRRESQFVLANTYAHARENGAADRKPEHDLRPQARENIRPNNPS
jgi:hypothetical protein